jgi:hypothetical protein
MEHNTVKMHFMTYASRRFVLKGHFFTTNEAVSLPRGGIEHRTKFLEMAA